MGVTLICGYRDRDIGYVKRSVDSLVAQTCPDFELVIVDYGSSRAKSEDLAKLIGTYRFCRYVYSDTRGWLWNRSAALNAGGKLAREPYLFFTDVDIVYPRWFVETLLENVSDDVFLLADCLRSPRGFTKWDSVLKRREPPRWRSMMGQGLLCCPREIFERVGGLDERFGIWGGEDLDFATRLGEVDLKGIGLPRLYSFHQWHPRIIYQIPLPVQFQNLVRQYGRAFRPNSAVANDGRIWGRLVRAEDRPIYSLIEPDSGKCRSGVTFPIDESWSVSGLTRLLNAMVNSGRALWAFPLYKATDLDGRLVNKLLRGLGWRATRKLGYAADMAQGVALAIPELFADYYVGATINGRRYMVVLTRK